MSLSRGKRAAERLRHSSAAAFAFLALLFLPGNAQENLVDLPSFRDGCQALADERFESAITSLQQAWNAVVDAGGGDVEKDFVASRLLEAFVRNGQASKAKRWLRINPFPASSNDTLYWSAVANQAVEEFSAAARFFGELSNRLSQQDRSISLAHATCLTLSGNQDASLDVITALGEPTSIRESLIFAQVATRANQLDTALNFLKAPSTDETTPRKYRVAITALRSHLLREMGQGQTNDSEIISLIESASTEEEALTAFLLFEETAPIRFANWLQSSAKAWGEKTDHPAADCHRFFLDLATAGGDQEKRQHLTRWAKEATDSLTASEATLRLLSSSTATAEKLLSGSGSLPGGTDRVEFATARSLYYDEQFSEAASSFLQNAEASTGESRARSQYNAAIARLKDSDFKGFQALFDSLRKTTPDSPFLADLQYAAGLHLATTGDPHSIEYLEPFVRENPDHPSLVEAMLSLAELHLNQAPARPQAASDILERLRTRPLTLEQSERLDYSSIWLEVIRNDDNATVAAASAFLKNWPGSRHHAEVAMLLAQSHYQNNQFDSALEIFDRIANEFPQSPLAARATFFAARASSRTLSDEENAEVVKRWETIANSDSEFALPARYELALHHLARDRFALAREEFQKAINTSSPNDPLHFALRSDFAFSFFAEALAKNHDKPLLETSAAAFAEISADPNAPATVKHEAAVRRARCLESLGQKPLALEVYRELITETKTEVLSPIHNAKSDSNEWIFRAGFSAIEILREQKDWKQAIHLADTLARKDGARAIEASRLAERMRLKHWVWE